MNLQRLKELEKRSAPVMQIAEMTTFLNELFVKFSGNLPEGDVLGFVTESNLETFDEFRSILSETITYIESLEKKVKAGEELAEAVQKFGRQEAQEEMGNLVNNLWYIERDHSLITYRKQVE
jgi:hypothetical protein